jgi:hypothetical protein
MNWVEIIALRSNGNIQQSVIQELLKLGADGDERNGLTGMKIYRNAWINTDISIHLHWKSTPTELRGSAMGLRLLYTLKEFGLVNHSIWVEERKQS